MRTIIFDLDDTLVDTSSLRTFRELRRWDDVSSNLSKFRPFPGVIELFKWLRSIDSVKIAVVTNSPRRYAQEILKTIGIEVDALVTYGDTKYPKPTKEPIEKAIYDLNGTPDLTIAIGDRCVDIEAARGADVTTIGVQWGQINQRDLILSNPDHIVSSISQLRDLLEEWIEGELRQTSQTSWGEDYWLDSPRWDRRVHLENSKLDYSFVYSYYKGGWISSRANKLISDLKSKGDKQSFFKNVAAKSFAHDLGIKIPQSASVVFVMPAALEGSPDYDNRWELVQNNLKNIRRDIRFVQCVRTVESSIPAHQQDASSESRKPEVIESRLKWVGGDLSDCSDIVVVDDVVTKGGHLNAYHNLIEKNLPHVKIKLLAWAAFTSDAWYEGVDYPFLPPQFKRDQFSTEQSLGSGQLFNHTYSSTSRVFKIFNLHSFKEESNCTFVDAVLRKILHRSPNPKPSEYIQNEICELDSILSSGRKKFLSLCSLEHSNVWSNTIKGGENSNPALDFYKRLESLPLVRYLMYPECPLSEIFEQLPKKFHSQQVDFYLPQAKLVIEFDGVQHNEVSQQLKDQDRDHLFKSAKIEVLRISSSNELATRNLLSRLTDFEKSKTLQAYKAAAHLIYNNPENREVVLALISRFQVAICELIIRDALNWNEQWKFIIINDDIPTESRTIDWAKIAIEDLFMLRRALGALNSEKLTLVDPVIEYCTAENSREADEETLVVDISVLSKWDEQTKSPGDKIVIRNHYIERIYVETSKGIVDEAADHYQHFSHLPGKWDLDSNLNEAEKALKRVLSYLFGFDEFNAGQCEIITHALQNDKTVGLLATGGGKSLCFHFVNLLQPSTCVVICPIKSLMFDQCDELVRAGIKRTCYINSEVKGADRARLIHDIRKGRYHFVFVAPERFQTQEFRQMVSQLYAENRISGFVIDEAHCMSEWGHDFRVSYLNLANTLKRVARKLKVMLLTATASSSVLKDLKIEFELEDRQVIAPAPPKRKELEFKVLKYSDPDTRRLNITSTIEEARELRGGSGLVFCPYVNGDDGVYNVSCLINSFANDYSVYFYSGSKPRNAIGIGNFELHKKESQAKFKKDSNAVLVATKAFGMGVNKRDVNFTIHAGIPSSMEALYQEAGRAGRNKQDSTCYVLFNEEKSDVDKWCQPNQSIQELKRAIDIPRHLKGDFLAQMYFLTSNEESIAEHAAKIADLAVTVLLPTTGPLLNAGSLGYDGNLLEKDIYRLSQLGIVTDWTVEDFFAGRYTIRKEKQVTFAHIADRLLSTIGKYSAEQVKNYEVNVHTTIENFRDSSPCSETYEVIEALAVTLLEWNYDQFVWTRRKSLQNLYEACQRFDESGKQGFKKILEDAFTVNDLTFLVRELYQNPAPPEKWLDILEIEEPNTVEIIIQNLLMDDNVDDDVSTLYSQLLRFEETTGMSSFLSFTLSLCRAALGQNQRAERDLLASFDQIRRHYGLPSQTCINLFELVRRSPKVTRDIVAMEIAKEDLDWLSLGEASSALQHPILKKQVLSQACNKLQAVSDLFAEKLKRTN